MKTLKTQVLNYIAHYGLDIHFAKVAQSSLETHLVIGSSKNKHLPFAHFKLPMTSSRNELEAFFVRTLQSYLERIFPEPLPNYDRMVNTLWIMFTYQDVKLIWLNHSIDSKMPAAVDRVRLCYATDGNAGTVATLVSNTADQWLFGEEFELWLGVALDRHEKCGSTPYELDLSQDDTATGKDTDLFEPEEEEDPYPPLSLEAIQSLFDDKTGWAEIALRLSHGISLSQVRALEAYLRAPEEIRSSIPAQALDNQVRAWDKQTGLPNKVYFDLSGKPIGQAKA